ncbi:hypothetical protein LguiB_032888 [Lonicera macranthoides]
MAEGPSHSSRQKKRGAMDRRRTQAEKQNSGGATPPQHPLRPTREHHLCRPLPIPPPKSL